MKQILLSLSLLAGALLSGTEVFRCDFTPAELAHWKMPPQAARMSENGFDFVRFTVTEAKKAGQNLMTAPFDISAYRGKYLQVDCRIRAFDVSTPPASYNGVKVMISYKTDLGTEWRNTARVWGSFDWRKVSFAFQVPESAVGGVFHLGLQDSSGTVDFADLTVEEQETAEFYPPVAKLPEGFRAEYTSRVASVPRLRGAMSPDAYRKGDLDVLASWGANLVRWQFTRNWGQVGSERDLVEYNGWIDSKLDEFEQVIADCERLGMKVVLDLHTPPGGINQELDMAMFHEPEYAQAFIDVWKKIARRFKGRNSAVFGYNLVNEPNQWRMTPNNYLKLQYDAALAIRGIDPEIPIIIESNLSSAPETFEYLTPLPIKDVIYQVHMYKPMQYTHQGIQGMAFSVYPGVFNGVHYDRETLRKVLEPVRKFQEKYGARIYVGEFAATRWAEGAERYMGDVISICEEYGWDWSYHAFRESKTWDVEYEGGSHGKGEVKAAAPTARFKVLQEGFRRNRSGQE